MSNSDKLLRLFSHSARGLVAGARKRSVSKFTAELHKLDFLLTNFVPSSPKVKATATTPAILPVKQEIQLLMIDDVKFAKLIAGEAHKFFLASMVSLERSRQSQQHNIAWQIVEHYYAAYYAVHYLMRISGYSLTNIDEKALKSILKPSTVPITDPQGGLCTMTFSSDCTDILIIKNEKGGGSHKEAWSIWVKILEGLIEDCKKDHTEYSSLELEIQSHKKFIAINDQKFNPSEIRAEVNYQFRGESWCFENNTNSKITNLQREISSDDYSLTINNDKIINLINHNKLIIKLAKDFFRHATNDYPNGICRSLHHQFKNKISTLP